MKKCEFDDLILFTISKEKVIAVITDYYKNKEEFDGDIEFEIIGQYTGKDWGGFDDYSGRMNLILKKEITILDQKIIKESKINQKDIPLKRIFSTMFEEEDYEIESACLDIHAYSANETKFNGLNLFLKSKPKDKVLKKCSNCINDI